MLGVSLHLDYGTLVTEEKKNKTLCTMKIMRAAEEEKEARMHLEVLTPRLLAFRKFLNLISLITPNHILKTGH